MLDNIKTVSFAHLVKDRDADVRVFENCVVVNDLIMVMTGKDRNQAGEVLRRLPEEIFSSSKLLEKNIGGSGNVKTKCVLFKDAIELVMVLPGKVAKETRAQFADVIRRYMAGDESMHAELRSNAESNSPIAQMARASLQSDQPSEQDQISLNNKRKREELELLSLEQDLRAKMHDNAVKIMTSYQALCTDTTMDERARLMFKDYFLNITNLHAPSNPQQAIENGETASNRPVSLSNIALELGYRLKTDQAKAVGIRLKKLYMEKHNKAPPKHEQLCDGRVTLVNSYTARDRSLIESVLREFMSPRDPLATSSDSCV
jgi:hypothetical protein